MVRYRTIRSWGVHSAANLAQTGQRKFWQIEIGNFLRKTGKFCANRPHTAPGGARQCRRILRAPAVSSRNVTGRICHLLFYTKQVSSPCHVSATHSMCSKNPPAVPRHTAPPGAVCGLFAQNLSVLRQKLPVSICQNFLWPVCAWFAAKCPPQLRIVLWPTIRLRNPDRFTLDKRRIGPEMSK